MTEQATRRSLARRRLLSGCTRPARRPDRPVADPSGRGRGPRAVGPAAPSPYRRDAPLGLLCRRPLPARAPCEAATHHLRDWRDNTQLPVDPKLLDLLWSLRAALDTSDPIQVFCGYRSPETNAMLRRTRHGAARHSLHMRAMAIDLQVEGRPLRGVRRAAVALEGRRRRLLSALRLRPRRHRRHPLLVSRRRAGRAIPGTRRRAASSAHRPRPG